MHNPDGWLIKLVYCLKRYKKDKHEQLHAV